MQTEKQKWIEDVLQSTEGMCRADTPDLSDKVMAHIGAADRHQITPAPDASLIWKIAASVLFLMLLNAVTIYSYERNIKNTALSNERRSEASELGYSQTGTTDPGTVIFGK